MLKEKYQAAEREFLKRYPMGFETPELMEVGKKHKMDKLTTFVNQAFNQAAFEDENLVFTNFTKLISQSSLVSVFEKTKFRNVVKVMPPAEQTALVKALFDLLHGSQERGFSLLVDLLSPYQLAKWPILTVLGLYWSPQTEVLVKPTTVKGILAYFEVTDFKYTSKPTYDFYLNYKNFVNQLKTNAQEVMQVDNGAFCGFLMMTLDDLKAGK